jgi:hypothetical protein
MGLLGSGVGIAGEKIGGAIGGSLASRSSRFVTVAEGASAGEKMFWRLGLVGALAAGALGAYSAPEIKKFQDNIKMKVCGKK